MQRVIDELKELRDLTSDARGAQRVAFTPTWARAREWLRARLADVPGVEVKNDPAGNLWATLRGTSARTLVLGGHLDSVPGGGWLDGALGTVAGLNVLRRLAGEKLPMTVRLVDWCDEEGARFGRSLFGSSAASGTLVPDDVRFLTDKDGVRLIDAARDHGVDLHRVLEAKHELRDVAAYLELHIEQGPVLEGFGLPLGVVQGTFGVERHAVAFEGRAAHGGSTPMDQRQDALAGASRLHLAVRDAARKHGGVGTVGNVVVRPGIPTAVVGEARLTVDLRHLDAKKLAAMVTAVRAASDVIAREEKIEAEWSPLQQLAPVAFDAGLMAKADVVVAKLAGKSVRLPSGPLHDAAEMARAGVPTAMLFVQSLGGVSHHADEDTKEEHLLLAAATLDSLAAGVLADSA